MKFLKAVRLDDSDARILAEEARRRRTNALHTADLAKDFPAEVWIAVKREPIDKGWASAIP